MALGIEDLKTRSASADVGERFHRDIRLLAQLLHRLVNCAGGSAGALLGVLGRAAGFFPGRAGHVEQDDDRIGTSTS